MCEMWISRTSETLEFRQNFTAKRGGEREAAAKIVTAKRTANTTPVGAAAAVTEGGGGPVGDWGWVMHVSAAAGAHTCMR